MKRLTVVLNRYARVMLGEELAPLDKVALTRDLNRALRSTDLLLKLAASMIVAMFAAALGVIVSSVWRDRTPSVFALFGATSSTMVYMMIRLWRERTALELILVLVRGTTPAFSETLIAVIRAYLLKPKATAYEKEKPSVDAGAQRRRISPADG